MSQAEEVLQKPEIARKEVYDRAYLIREAIIFGLQEKKLFKAAKVFSGLQFDIDTLRNDRIVVYIPPTERATDDVISYLCDAIDSGLKMAGYYDPVWIEAPYRWQLTPGSPLLLPSGAD